MINGFRIAILILVVATVGCSAHRHTIRNGQVCLSLRIAGAVSVQFASSLDNHRLRPAVRTASGEWIVTVPADREFRYYYLVDGKPALPDCPMRERDDFGSENCIHTPVP